MTDEQARLTVTVGPPLYHSERMRFCVATLTSPDGAVIERGLLQHPGSVVIAAVTDTGAIVMIENHRWSVGETLLELPAGTLAWGEDPLAAARRELREETGYEAEQLEPLMHFYAAPGSSDELMRAFVGRGLRHVGQRLQADEEITARLVDATALPALLENGLVRDAKSLAVLSRLLLQRR